MKVGDLVRKTSAWCDSREKELGKTGIITEIGSNYLRWVHVQWSGGQKDKHRKWELVVIEDPKTKKKPYFETWQIKF